jgi:hypothetical protein
VRDAANQGAEVITLPELYQVIISVKVKMLTILPLPNHYTALPLSLCALARTRSGNHCSFLRKKEWLASIITSLHH